MKSITRAFTYFVPTVTLIGMLITPFSAVAALPGIKCGVQGAGDNCLIPCDGVDNPCDFADFEQLAMNLMYYMVYISVPLAAVAFAYAGFLYITSGGNPGQASRARKIFTNVGIGFVVILAAWLLVYTITSALLDTSNYDNPLKP
ncbi:MAG TPA: pilin [Candidatus Paceibacterota bacterium]|nr:pilin [Candidatus Paceibacterota bacterium]